MGPSPSRYQISFMWCQLYEQACVKLQCVTTAKPIRSIDFSCVAQVHLDTVEVVLTQREEPNLNFTSSEGAGMSSGPSSRGAG